MKVYFIIMLMLLIVSAGFVSASFIKGDGSIIEKEYGAGDSLRGWINISLQDEPIDSLMSAFDSNIEILEFLENNELDSGISQKPTENVANNMARSARSGEGAAQMAQLAGAMRG